MCNKWDIEKQFIAVKDKIKNIIIEAERSKNSVRILAVSKGHNVKKIQKLYSFGHKDFGENYIQELERKRIFLKDKCSEIRWHYIGNVQTNKSLCISKNFAVHSVASLKQAKFLAKYRNTQCPLYVFLKTNIVEIGKLTNLKIQGLMTILPLEKNKKRFWFLSLKALRDELQTELKTTAFKLSMGMSDDFKEAIECGSSWVRIGSAIFGPKTKRNNIF